MLKFGELCVNLQPKLDKTILMKQIKATFMLLAAMIFVASCAGSSSNETTLYGEAAITAFSVSKAKRTTTTESSDGTITTTTSTYTATSYKFVIDQLNHEIYNPDSLPEGTNPSRLLCSLTTYHNSVALFKDLEEEDTWFYYSSTDSIDFSSPRQVRVFSSDGTGYTDYTIKVNVHQETADKFVWTDMSYVDGFAELDGIKVFYDDDKFYVFGNYHGVTTITSTTNGKDFNYDISSINFGADAWKNTALMMGDFYVLDNNTIYRSPDAITWETYTIKSDKPISRLIGASTFKLYALNSDGELIASDGVLEGSKETVWEKEECSDPSVPIPTEDVAMICYPVTMADFSEQVLLVGNTEISFGDHNYAFVWRKIIDFNLDLSWGLWTYMDRGDSPQLTLPRAKDITLLRYDDSILAFYGKTNGESSTQPYATMLQSRDNGITWKTSSAYTMPTTDLEPTMVSGAVDKNNNIWLFYAGGRGEVIKGYLPRVAWKNN